MPCHDAFELGADLELFRPAGDGAGESDSAALGARLRPVGGIHPIWGLYRLNGFFASRPESSALVAGQIPPSSSSYIWLHAQRRH